MNYHSNQAKNKKTKVNSGKLLNIHLFSDNPICSGLRRKIEESKMEMKKLDDKKEDLVLMNVEKELWESGDWRENIKDLNSSFSKLPPIIKENRVKHGKSQAFVVDWTIYHKYCTEVSLFFLTNIIYIDLLVLY